jgi:hypothetical protein
MDVGDISRTARCWMRVQTVAVGLIRPGEYGREAANTANASLQQRESGARRAHLVSRWPGRRTLAGLRASRSTEYRLCNA